MQFEIKFTGNYDDSDDRLYLKKLLLANDVFSVLFEITYNLWRNCDTIDEYKENINRIIENHNINLEELTQ